MATLPYITVERAKTLLIDRGHYTPETIPSDIELTYRIDELSAILDQWFNFRFPETDYVELLRCYGLTLTLNQYPVSSVTAIEYRLPALPNKPVVFTPTVILWHGGRTLSVPRAGYYRVTFAAGYPPEEVATLEPFIMRTLAKYDDLAGFDWLLEPAGVVTEVSMPGGISQKKEYRSSKYADPIGSRTIDRLLASFTNFRRRVLT
jgi:hypothetical protein